jgi:hypothetical protein
VPDLEACKFLPPQCAIDKHAQNCEGALSEQSSPVRSCQEAFGFLAGEPVAEPHAARRNPGHGQDAGGFDRVKEVVLASLVDKFADRRGISQSQLAKMAAGIRMRHCFYADECLRRPHC